MLRQNSVSLIVQYGLCDEQKMIGCVVWIVKATHLPSIALNTVEIAAINREQL